MNVINEKAQKILIYWGLFIVALLFFWMVSAHVDPQGTFDSAYYHILVDRLEAGRGLTEPFIWNFLNERQSIEHPVDYWMPMGIYLYFGARKIAGVGGEVFLNCLIWAFLSLMVYRKVFALSRSRWSALFAFACMVFCGRNLYYLLTTDNIAFYGLAGYLFFVSIDNREAWFGLAVASGFAALTRIEGSLIAILGLASLALKHRRINLVAKALLIVLLIVSPWLLRNHLVLGKIWTSNFKALLITEYGDIFSSEFSGTLENFLGQGHEKIIKQRFNGLLVAVVNFLAVPGMFVLYPLWLAGLPIIWKNEGRCFVVILMLFLLFCGLLVPLQSEKGTAMHISAFFIPYFAVLAGLGLYNCRASLVNLRPWHVMVPLLIVLWMMIASIYSVAKLNDVYAEEVRPYREMASLLKEIAGDACVASNFPVRVYLETGISGIVASSHSKIRAETLAEMFGCSFILQDTRAEGPNQQEPVGYQIVAKNDFLKLWQKGKESF